MNVGKRLIKKERVEVDENKHLVPFVPPGRIQSIVDFSTPINHLRSLGPLRTVFTSPRRTALLAIEFPSATTGDHGRISQDRDGSLTDEEFEQYEEARARSERRDQERQQRAPTMSITRKEILPETFQLGQNFSYWKERFFACANSNEWNEAAQIRHLPSFLQGEVFGRYLKAKEANPVTIKEWMEELRKAIYPEDQVAARQAEFFHRKKKLAESVTEFAYDLKKLGSLAFPGDETSSVYTKLLLRRFLEGLEPAELRKLTGATRPTTIDQAMASAVNNETLLSRQGPTEETVNTIQGDPLMNQLETLFKQQTTALLSVLQTAPGTGNPGAEGNVGGNHNQMTYQQGSQQGNFRGQGFFRGRGRGRGFAGNCFACGGYGHSVRYCRSMGRMNFGPQAMGYANNQGGGTPYGNMGQGPMTPGYNPTMNMGNQQMQSNLQYPTWSQGKN